ncbi:MAG TPA: hypothetical protein VGY54_01420 [Polyangiaceae bacterium]|jgi:hypothetical protein|nr:hypothetical protein [Polyangiaceae bacterium]
MTQITRNLTDVGEGYDAGLQRAQPLRFAVPIGKLANSIPSLAIARMCEPHCTIETFESPTVRPVELTELLGRAHEITCDAPTRGA